METGSFGRFLGKLKAMTLGTEYDDMMDETTEETEPVYAETARGGHHTSTARARTGNIVDMPARAPSGGYPGNEIIQPKTIDEARYVADRIREGKTCVVKVGDVDKAAAKRILDFLCGATYILRGSVNQIAGHTFMFAPEHVPVHDATRDTTPRDSHHFPWSGGGR